VPGGGVLSRGGLGGAEPQRLGETLDRPGPAVIPAARQATFTGAFTPHGRASRTCSAARAPRAACCGRAITGTRPACDTRCGSSKRRVDLRQLMQQLHLRGVLSSSTTVASVTPIVPAQRAPFASTRPNSPYSRGGWRLRSPTRRGGTWRNSVDPTRGSTAPGGNRPSRH
jgi:hypothetical protein